MLRDDVVIERLAQLFVGDGRHRAIMRVRCRIADQDIDLAKCLVRFINQILQAFLGRQA